MTTCFVESGDSRVTIRPIPGDGRIVTFNSSPYLIALSSGSFRRINVISVFLFMRCELIIELSSSIVEIRLNVPGVTESQSGCSKREWELRDSASPL